MTDQPEMPIQDDDDTDLNAMTRPVTPVTGTRRRAPIPPDEDTSASSRTPPRAYRPPNRPADRATPIPPASYYPPEPAYTPPRAKPGRRGAARGRRDSGLYLPWWSLVVMLALVGGLAFGALLVVNTLGGQAAPGGATPIIVVITATYTVGPPASQTPIPLAATLTPTAPLPTIAPSATLPPGNFAVGSMVQIIGVGVDGLNIRSGPGKSYTAKFLGHDGDKFLLKEGPQSADSEEWWHIQDPTNPGNDGWASRRFLTVLAPTP